MIQSLCKMLEINQICCWNYSFLYVLHRCLSIVTFIFHSCSKSYRNTKHTQRNFKLDRNYDQMYCAVYCSLNRGGGYELIDLPTLSTGHCLLACGVRSYSVLHRVNASNCSIEFRPRSRPPRQPLTCHTWILSNLYRILCRKRHISNTTSR